MIKDKYSRQRYEKLKANNLCAHCGKPLDRQGALCTACKDKHNAYNRDIYKKLQAVGVCPRCGKNLLYGDEKSCIDCRAKSAKATAKKRTADVKKYNEQQKVWRKARYEKDKENGICTHCRKRKADPGYRTCTYCREIMRNARIKMPKRTDRYEQRLCFFCDNPVKPGYKVCEKHYQQNVKNATCEKANLARQKTKERSPQWKP